MNRNEAKKRRSHLEHRGEHRFWTRLSGMHFSKRRVRGALQMNPLAASRLILLLVPFVSLCDQLSGGVDFDGVATFAEGDICEVLGLFLTHSNYL